MIFSLRTWCSRTFETKPRSPPHWIQTRGIIQEVVQRLDMERRKKSTLTPMPTRHLAKRCFTVDFFSAGLLARFRTAGRWPLRWHPYLGSVHPIWRPVRQSHLPVVIGTVGDPAPGKGGRRDFWPLVFEKLIQRRLRGRQ